MKPTLNIYGIAETKANANKFVPHYKVLASKLYSPSRLTLFNPKSVMFTRSSFGDLDFWNSDSDFTYAEDALSFNEFLNFSSNHAAYFQSFMKVMRIAHGHYGEDLTDTRWTKNKAHMLDIFSSMLVSEVIMVSPILRDILIDKELPQVFSKKVLKVIESKMLVLPPPDLYKFEPPEDTTKSFKTLKFLWNHRFTASKNPKAFFGIIDEFHKQFPKVPLSIIVLSSLTTKEVMGHVPPSLQKFVDLRPYAYDDKAYEKSLMDANVTLGTSMAESYGIAILEAARYGSAVFNLPCNQAFTNIIGPSTTLKPKEIIPRLNRLALDKEYAAQVIGYTNKGLAKITTTTQYKKALSKRLAEVLEARFDRTSTKSPKLATVLKALDKKALTKREVYEAMGWNSRSSQPVNTFWGDYYYGLRKLGVKTTLVNNKLYFYTQAEPKLEVKKSGLF
jgi:hypothetical protein